MVNIFSFCVYGSNPMYCKGMLENLILIRDLFPTFETWIYYGVDVPSSYISEYTTFKNVKCISTGETGGRLMTRRFFAIDNPSVDLCFVRDADSRVYERDEWCIRQFMASDKLFHIIRDNYHHRMKIMGGMWGIKRGCLNENINDLYNEWLNNSVQTTSIDDYMSDQHFLRDSIYPKIKNNVLIHSNLVGFEGEVVSPIDYPNTGTNFVGNVYEYDGCRFVPFFNNKHYPRQEHISFLRSQHQYNLINNL